MSPDPGYELVRSDAATAAITGMLRRAPVVGVVGRVTAALTLIERALTTDPRAQGQRI